VANDNIANLQKSMVKEFIISLELKSEIDKNLLMSIEGITNVKAENNKYIIFASMDVREFVAALSSQNNWLILSMSLEEKSLEEVFQNLTN
jgi:type III secretory pathway component EscV